MAVFPLSAKHRKYALRALAVSIILVSAAYIASTEGRSASDRSAWNKTAAAVLGRQRRSDGILGAGGGAAGRLAGGRAGAFGYGAGRDCPNHGKIWRRSRFAAFACRPVGSCFGRRRRQCARSAVFTDEDGERNLVALEKGGIWRRSASDADMKVLPTLRSVVVKTSARGSLARAEVPVEIRESLSGILLTASALTV